MSKSLSIRLKAGFLILVFGLNMIVGFACALGVDMGFNTAHHHQEATEIHIHADESKHDYTKKEHEHSGKQEKDNCCKDETVKFSQADKILSQYAKIQSPVFFTAFITTYYNINVPHPEQINVSNKYFVRGYHPPIPDIRIAIQSFQI